MTPVHAQPSGRRGTVGHAYSALNLRLLLAGFGLITCAALAVFAFTSGSTGLGVALVALAAIAAVDLVVIQRRRSQRHRDEPGVHHSLFE